MSAFRFVVDDDGSADVVSAPETSLSAALASVLASALAFFFSFCGGIVAVG